MKKVLVVEDCFATQISVKMAVEEAGGKVRVVSRAEDALRVLEREGDFDCILTDIGLPRMDGLTFVRNLRVQYPDVQWRIVVMSAYGDKMESALVAGANAFIQKPFGEGELLSVLNISPLQKG